METIDRSVSISILNDINPTIDFQTIFFILSNVNNPNRSLNSQIAKLNIIPKSVSIDNIQITFRHLNESSATPMCVHLKNSEE